MSGRSTPSEDDAAWEAIVAALGPLQPTDDDEDPPSAIEGNQPRGASAPTDRGDLTDSAANADIADGFDVPEGDGFDSEYPERAPAGWREAAPLDPFARIELAYEDDDDEDDPYDAFVPPDPGPIFSGDPLLTLAWVCIVGSPIGLFLITLFWRSAPQLLAVGLIVAFLASAAVLLWRMPSEREDQHGGPVI